ncbi:MAG: AAA family ATPase [Sporomusaceae bacterium]|jgi:nitrogenase iron protein NifH|nr:AAA family ATPase [Sporomusaceae bacterium]
MKKFAFYGKGGIGKSTTAANVSAALAEKGHTVCQIGCDPKNDSTRLLLGKTCPGTVLDTVKKYGEEFSADRIIHHGYRGVECVEAGGPEPGVGCAGRGIIVALEKLKTLKILEDDSEKIVLYDVLGDVVCGGFAVPIREGYANDIYIVSSGELMSLYAANNIAKGIAKFAARGKVRLGGIIGNSRNLHNEKNLLTAFAAKLNTKLTAFIPCDETVRQAEIRRQTVIEYLPESSQADEYRNLSQIIMTNQDLSIPTPLEFEELETMVFKYGHK